MQTAKRYPLLALALILSIAISVAPASTLEQEKDRTREAIIYAGADQICGLSGTGLFGEQSRNMWRLNLELNNAS